jgi:hypothetical protein
MAQKEDNPGGKDGAAPTRAAKGDWVQIHSVALPAGRRAPNIPPETQAVPLEMRVKGFLAGEGGAALGDEVAITTVIGRVLRGRLVAVNPVHGHDFGAPVPELLTVGMELRARLLARGDDRGGGREGGAREGGAGGAGPS